MRHQRTDGPSSMALAQLSKTTRFAGSRGHRRGLRRRLGGWRRGRRRAATRQDGHRLFGLFLGLLRIERLELRLGLVLTLGAQRTGRRQGRLDVLPTSVPQAALHAEMLTDGCAWHLFGG